MPSEAFIMLRKLFCPVVFFICAGTLLGQSVPPNSTQPSQGWPGRRGGQASCLQQAGIEKSVMEQIHSIRRDARSQVESVCSNSSLTPQRKQQQVSEIKEQAMRKREGLITPDQEKALTACQQARGGNHANAGGPHEGLGGGCGEFSRNGSRPGGSANRAPNSGTSTPSSNQ